MAHFEEAYKKTLSLEGGYAKDPHDAGGETYKGVSRRFNPSWIGWRLIDELKVQSESAPPFPESLEQSHELQAEVQVFYKQHYWDKFRGDEIQDQALAEELFDTGVNMGVHRAVTFLQEGLNLLNRNQENYLDIAEDGRLGPRTLKVLKAALRVEGGDPSYLLKIMNILQGRHYIEYMKRNPAQEKYAIGWLRRVEIRKARPVEDVNTTVL